MRATGRPPIRLTRRPSPGRLLPAAAGIALGAATVLAAQVVWVVRRKLPTLTELDVSGPLAGHLAGAPVRMVALGDSTLTGPGLETPADVWIRQALAEIDVGRPVDLVSLARGGSRAADVRRRVDEAVAVGADLAVIAVGANDAIHGTPPARFAADLDATISQLLDHVAVVAVANLGDLGNLARVPRPLTAVLRRRSRTICRRIEDVVARHERAVLLDVTTSNVGFRDRSVFAADLFHP
ncbi:MAG: family lipase, partial [Acidimicrobiales bacterium]|nr:family lipase [Acidimicrobiales bacterium]